MRYGNRRRVGSGPLSRLLQADPAGVAEAARRLRQGAVVGYPTDTVYGLAALAGRPDAVRRVFEIKGRAFDQPLILMVAEAGQVEALAEVDGRARALMADHWPGPLTLVLRARPPLRPPLTRGEPPTVGVRVPDHPVALALLREVAEPLATTSANRSGARPALTAAETAGLVGVAAVLDGGPAPGGVPSTLLDLSGAEPRVLRPGPIPEARLLGG